MSVEDIRKVTIVSGMVDCWGQVTLVELVVYY